MALSMFIRANCRRRCRARGPSSAPRRRRYGQQYGAANKSSAAYNFIKFDSAHQQRRGAELISESESIDAVNQPPALATLDAIRARWQRDEADLDSKTEHLLKAAEDLTCDKDDYCILPKGHEGP